MLLENGVKKIVICSLKTMFIVICVFFPKNDMWTFIDVSLKRLSNGTAKNFKKIFKNQLTYENSTI